MWGHAWFLVSRQGPNAPTQQLAMDGWSPRNTCSGASRCLLYAAAAAAAVVLAAVGTAAVNLLRTGIGV